MGNTIPPHVDICFICVHYRGTKLIPIGEDMEDDYQNVCKAFPEGIPFEILIGDNKHLVPIKDQGNDLVFEMSTK